MSRLTMFHDVLDIDGRHILVHTQNGSVIELDDQKYHAYLSGEDCFLNLLSRDELDILSDTGFITEKSKEDEVNISKFNYHISKFKDSDTLKLDIAITPACNFKCTYCYEGFCKDKIVDAVTDEVRDSFVLNLTKYVYDLINKNHILKTIQVVFFGGEPLIEESLLIKVTKGIQDILYESNIDLEIVIVTNGYLLKPGNLLKENLPIKYIQVTVDGLQDVHDNKRMLKNGAPTFNEIINNIEKCLNNNINITVRVNVDKENLSSIKELLLFLDSKFSTFIDSGQLFIDIARIFGTSASLDYYSFFEKKNELRPAVFSYDLSSDFGRLGAFCCAESYNSNLILDVFGNTYQCWNYVYSRKNISGHINDIEITDDMIKNKLEYLEKASLDNFPECFRCKYQSICGGMCPDVRLNFLNGKEKSEYPDRCKEIIQNQLQHYYKFLGE